MEAYDAVIVGAGAAGLYAGFLLSKAGKKVLILEARERVGGRIYTFDSGRFGYSAEGGAEFVDGKAPITKELTRTSGAEYIKITGSMFRSIDGRFIPDTEFNQYVHEMRGKLAELTKDITISDFLNNYFDGDTYKTLRKSISQRVEAHDSGDPKKMSVLYLREDWIGEEYETGRLKKGYGHIISFLKTEIEKNKGEVKCGTEVGGINFSKEEVVVTDKSGTSYRGAKVIVTVPLPLLTDINFEPGVEDVINASEKIGNGNVIKILLHFKKAWWEGIDPKLRDMLFVFSYEHMFFGWTQHPYNYRTLTLWISGPTAKRYQDLHSKDIVKEALDALANMFPMIDATLMTESLLDTEVCNWIADEYTKGGYSYATPETEEALKIIRQPKKDKLFFAGEALHSFKERASVEAAFKSGEEVAQSILDTYL